MFVIIWRRSGLGILIYFFLIAWIVSHWYDDASLRNASYTGWVLFYSAIVCALHALLLLGSNSAKKDTDTDVNADADAGTTQPSTLWQHSLFFIPVLIWPFLFGAGSAYNFFGRSENPHHETFVPSAIPPKPVQKRTIHFLNPTGDSMYYEISSADGVYEKQLISPHKYISRTCRPGKYTIHGLSADGEEVYTFPSGEITADKSKCTSTKDSEGNQVFRRIIGKATESENDYDDIWVMLNGDRNMMIVEITDICPEGTTQSGIKKINWTERVKTVYDGQDIIEPLYETDPGEETFTVLSPGDDFPAKAGKNERIFALFTIDPEQEIDNDFIAGRILRRLPDLPE